MNGSKALLDTNIIIFASKQKFDIAGLLEKYDEFYASIITYMEVYGYNFDNLQEKEAIDELFMGLEIIEVNKNIAEHVIFYRKNKYKKIKLPDAIILATAKFLNADLITDDWDDFQGFEEHVRIIQLNTYKNDL
jgi:predicted nucleic acid-binding protein